MNENIKNYHGKQVTMDIKNFFVDAKIGGQFIFELMKKSLKLGTCREVHSKLVILGKDQSPPSEEGWTSIILVDESHLSAHCYSDRGIVSLDTFTCGSGTDPEKLAAFILEEIKKEYPDIVLVEKNVINRFPYYD
jgi:S-adenosylmethionine decarboxylase